MSGAAAPAEEPVRASGAAGDRGARENGHAGRPGRVGEAGPTDERGPSDARLLAGLAEDDEVAAAAFVRRFQDRVFGLAVSITHDAALAQDISQEVFVRAWRAGGRYDGGRASVLTWLLTITRNAAIDAVRAHRQTPTDGDELEEMISATTQAPSPEDEAVRRVECDAAVANLRALPTEQARAVVLAVIGGRTAAEVGAYEGIPVGTAKTRIRTGLRRVRQAMEQDRG